MPFKSVASWRRTRIPVTPPAPPGPTAWAGRTDTFPGAALNATNWPNTYGTLPTVAGNQASYAGVSATYCGIASNTPGETFIGKFTSVKIVKPTGGYGGITVKDNATNTDIGTIQWRSTTSDLLGMFLGSNWGGADLGGILADGGATSLYLRIYESSGSMIFQISTDGSTWSTITTQVLTAGALTALTQARIQFDIGPFPDAQTAGPIYSRFQLTP